ncbi:MAG TPA: ethanolamine ammonia-lyase subunit EutC [Fibrobacteria bacterium]|nr:ethanolamine ammonia-lyase subunit EutC [Fibrobacteria bacterium]
MSALLRETSREPRERTSARIQVGRAGTRPTTAQLLRFQEDHACAQDAVLATVDAGTPGRLGCVLESRSSARDKTEYLRNPGTGRKLAEGEEGRILARITPGAQVLVAVGDGLSPAAVEAQVPVLLPALLGCLRKEGFESIAGPVFVHLARVGVLDALGEILRPEVGILLVGERPGLATALSLSAYLGYRPGPGRSDADRNVLSNIHEGGIQPLQAAAMVARWAASMRRQASSGVGFRPDAG